ncbi:hypothetical protein KIN20_017063 [Parelaphostrongylus tenuis]|uniref:Uncharacterized protein n=1 Tax=Parelaphostrongylus tenuis TaxID=148309 RepID=A0AAD5MHD9_PARTN|nr:hypothetical protein KIN20_017063 [Parelaphostrongylus tenuis]
MLARENALRTQTHHYMDRSAHFRNSFNSGNGRRFADMNISMPVEMINRRSDVDRALAPLCTGSTLTSVVSEKRTDVILIFNKPIKSVLCESFRFLAGTGFIEAMVHMWSFSL